MLLLYINNGLAHYWLEKLVTCAKLYLEWVLSRNNVLTSFWLRHFWWAKLGVSQVVNQTAEWYNMPHSLPIFKKRMLFFIFGTFWNPFHISWWVPLPGRRCTKQIFVNAHVTWSCCCLGIAPRAQMLKMIACPLHPKWLHLPHAIEVKLHVLKSNVVILTLETAGTTGVWAVTHPCR